MKYTHIIYGLYDSRDKSKLVMYVGKTNRKLARRLKAHNDNVKIGRRGAWIAKLKSEGAEALAITIEVIESDCVDAWRKPEWNWVEHHRKINPLLLNDMPGGYGPGYYSPECRARLSKSQMGKKLTLEHRNKISLSHIGIKKPALTEVHRAKLRELMTGKKKTDSHRLAMSVSRLGKKLSRNHRRALSVSHIGIKMPSFTDAHKAAISAAAKGRKMPPRTAEHQAKLNKSNRGKKRLPFTEAHRAKMRYAWVLRKLKSK